MTEQEEQREQAELEMVHAELSTSLDRCRAMLRDCRTKLAANSDGEDEEREERRG